jgi:hypothetical protein
MREPKKLPWNEEYKVDVPEGQVGEWSIKHVTVDEEDEKRGRMFACNPSSMGRCVRAGVYTMLYHNGELWMSDTSDEIRDHLAPIHETKRAGGNVLINGLGIGVVTDAIASLENVTKVTVIENSPEVIELVGPTMLKKHGDKLEIIEADSYDFKPPKGERYTVVWHDIWLHLCTDNLDEMAKLHRKYGRRTDWQGSWGKELLRYRRQQDRSQGW